MLSSLWGPNRHRVSTLESGRKARRRSTMCEITVWGLHRNIKSRSLTSSNVWTPPVTAQGSAWLWLSASLRCMVDASGSNPPARDVGVRSVLPLHSSSQARHKPSSGKQARLQPGSVLTLHALAKGGENFYPRHAPGYVTLLHRHRR